jgi:hypothetical protein
LIARMQSVGNVLLVDRFVSQNNVIKSTMTDAIFLTCLDGSRMEVLLLKEACPVGLYCARELGAHGTYDIPLALPRTLGMPSEKLSENFL